MQIEFYLHCPYQFCNGEGIGDLLQLYRPIIAVGNNVLDLSTRPGIPPSLRYMKPLHFAQQ